MTDHILVERQGAIQIIRMNRPDKKNALTRAMYAKMSKALAEGDADPAIRVHVFLGVPGAFSSGNDLADFMVVATGGEGGTEVWDFLMALARTEKPMVSGVDGIAVGIGTTLNLHCDLTFATPRTLFRTPFVDLGLVPEAGLEPACAADSRPARRLRAAWFGRRFFGRAGESGRTDLRGGRGERTRSRRACRRKPDRGQATAGAEDRA